MISATEIILIVAGFAAIIIGYLLPAGRDMDEEDKMLMEKEIRELVKREVEDQKETIDDMVGDSVENSLDRTERAMERISNEKLSEIGEYSDTVINDIHKNHDEVMFMYDMLNDKHKNLTSVVSEVTRKADEAKKVVQDAEATAREAQMASNSLRMSNNDNRRAIYLDEDEETLAGIRIPFKEKTREPEPIPVQQTYRAAQPVQPNYYEPQPVQQTYREPQPVQQTYYEPQPVQQSYREPQPVQQSYREPQPVQQTYREPQSVQQTYRTPQPAPAMQRVPGVQNPPRSGYVDERNLKEFNGLDEIPAEVLSNEQISSLHVIGSSSEKTDMSAKVVPITEAVRVESKAKYLDSSMKELTANDPASQNRQILEMHKAGKSNMVIARELGLGIGEVKLVIDLSSKHRKVR